MTLLSGILTIFIFFALPETYVPLLIHRKAQKLRAETKDMRYYAKFSEDKGGAWKNLSVSLIIFSSRKCTGVTECLRALFASESVSGYGYPSFQDILPGTHPDPIDRLVSLLCVSSRALSTRKPNSPSIAAHLSHMQCCTCSSLFIQSFSKISAAYKRA